MEAQRSGERIRVLRVIARMNIGGPAYHVSLLSGRPRPRALRDPAGQRSRGRRRGAHSTQLAAALRRAATPWSTSLGPELRPLDDLRALRRARARSSARFRPDIVHTHTAKAGHRSGGWRARARGRPRARWSSTPTTGTCSRATSGRCRAASTGGSSERLARVSEPAGRRQPGDASTIWSGSASRPRARFAVVPLGLDLERFLERAARATATASARSWGSAADDRC